MSESTEARIRENKVRGGSRCGVCGTEFLHLSDDEMVEHYNREKQQRERWRGYCKDLPAMAAGMQPGIAMMGPAIDSAKEAIANDDAVASIAALESLRGFDSDD